MPSAMKNHPMALIWTPLMAFQAPTAYQPAQPSNPTIITMAIMAAGEKPCFSMAAPDRPYIGPTVKKPKSERKLRRWDR